MRRGAAQFDWPPCPCRIVQFDNTIPPQHDVPSEPASSITITGPGKSP